MPHTNFQSTNSKTHRIPKFYLFLEQAVEIETKEISTRLSPVIYIKKIPKSRNPNNDNYNNNKYLKNKKPKKVSTNYRIKGRNQIYRRNWILEYKLKSLHQPKAKIENRIENTKTD